MFPIAVRWQVVRNRQRGMDRGSIVDHAGCSMPAALEWWSNFERHGSPWNDHVVVNQHASAVRFNAPLLRALDSLVQAHPEFFLRKVSSIFRRLDEQPEWDRGWL